MMELAVPLALAVALAQGVRDARWRALVYVGVCLPDLLRGLLDLQGAGPPSLAHPLHSPLGLVAWCAAAALLFEEDWRARAFAALLAGSGLHLVVDALSAAPGSNRGILWAFPFSLARLELGWLTESRPWVLRTAAAVILTVALAGARLRRRS